MKVPTLSPGNRGYDVVTITTTSAMLGPWNRDFQHHGRAGHLAGRRCSSLTYAQYAHSSRLARRAPRSGTCPSYHGSRGLARRVLGRARAERERHRALEHDLAVDAGDPAQDPHPAAQPIDDRLDHDH